MQSDEILDDVHIRIARVTEDLRGIQQALNCAAMQAPGDPELITLKGRRALEQADTVLYDHLANEALLALAPKHAERLAARAVDGLARMKARADLGAAPCRFTSSWASRPSRR